MCVWTGPHVCWYHRQTELNFYFIVWSETCQNLSALIGADSDHLSLRCVNEWEQPIRVWRRPLMQAEKRCESLWFLCSLAAEQQRRFCFDPVHVCVCCSELWLRSAARQVSVHTHFILKSWRGIILSSLWVWLNICDPAGNMKWSDCSHSSGCNEEKILQSLRFNLKSGSEASSCVLHLVVKTGSTGSSYHPTESLYSQEKTPTNEGRNQFDFHSLLLIIQRRTFTFTDGVSASFWVS